MFKHNEKEWIARSLARAFLYDTANVSAPALRNRAEEVLGNTPSWITPVLESLAQIPAKKWQAYDLDSLTQFILHTSGFVPAPIGGAPPQVRKTFLYTPSMRAPAWAMELGPLPSLTTSRELADWLELDLDRLLWLTSDALAWREHSLKQPVHYRYRLQAKARGGLRLIEIPKADLKQAQKHILRNLLHQIPVHEAAHGFVPGRSVASHAKAHTGQQVVIHFDLQDFFTSIRASRIHALWKTLGYPASVCSMLTTLCTTRTSSAVIARMREENEEDGNGWIRGKRLANAHLPQGAPSSPALANLCAFSLDVRLNALAESFDACYTRYADDLVFSGSVSLRNRLPGLHAWVALIVEDEGFMLHPRKTCCMPQHRQQRVTGVVVNQFTNTPRKDYERLKARLHQCVLHGAVTQNTDGIVDFRSHLLGHINWIGQFNTTRKAKLMRLFTQISW